MTFKIVYYAPDQKHITLHSDGSIELFFSDGTTIILDYAQARILKKMILAEDQLDKK